MDKYVDNKLALILALPFIAVFALGILVEFAVKFDPPFSAEEKELLSFRPNELNIKERKTVFVKKRLKSPVIMVVPEKKDIIEKTGVIEKVKDRNVAALLSGAKSKSNFYKVSFILIKSDKDKSAIINGAVLKEGDRTGNARVIRIERDRVLIKEGETGVKWLQLN